MDDMSEKYVTQVSKFDLVDSILKRYQSHGDIPSWPVPKFLSEAPEVTCRNQFADRLSTQSAKEIVAAYIYMTAEDMGDVLNLVKADVLPEALSGVGLELGAGCGLLSAVTASHFDVDGILALEVVDGMATKIIPIVSASILGDAKKVVPVIGSFDDLQINDEAIDFVIEIDSLHHSPDLLVTLKETARVMKKGGYLLCLDRAHADWTTDEWIEEFLSRVYSKNFLIENGYPEDIVLTRRENGEHEYRLKEWKAAFESAGFSMEENMEMYAQISNGMALKAILSLLPRFFTRRLFRGSNLTIQILKIWWAAKMGKKLPYGLYGNILYGPIRKTVFLLKKV